MRLPVSGPLQLAFTHIRTGALLAGRPSTSAAGVIGEVTAFQQALGQHAPLCNVVCLWGRVTA